MPSITTDEFPAYLAELESLPLTSLRQRWAEVFGNPAPVAARSDYLIRAIAFRIQEEVCNQSASLITRRIKKLVSISSGQTTSSLKRSRSLQAGTRLLREWQGGTHEVEITGDGYRYQGEIYSSLSQIARLITGTRWSGPLFFGLRESSSKPIKSERKTARPSYVVDLGSKRRPEPLDVTPPPRHSDVAHGL